MVNKKPIKKAVKLEKKEKKWLLREYSYLDKLKKDVEKKDKKAAERLAIKMGQYEPRLERTHKKVLESLKSLKKEGLVGEVAKKFDSIEEKINVFRADIVKEISRYTGELKDLIKQEKWQELEDSIVKRLEKDIQGWIILDGKLIKFEEELIKKGHLKKHRKFLRELKLIFRWTGWEGGEAHIYFKNKNIEKKLKNLDLGNLSTIIFYLIGNIKFVNGEWGFHPNALYMFEYDEDPNLPKKIREKAKELTNIWKNLPSGKKGDIAEELIELGKEYVDYKLKEIKKRIPGKPLEKILKLTKKKNQ